MNNFEVFERLSKRPEILALCLCGSHRMDVQDAYSDADVWVFMEPKTPLSDVYCLDNLIPADLGIEILSEGRDDSLVPFSVYNLLTEDGILNLKFISLDVLTGFVKSSTSFDHGYLDDLENYSTMCILWQLDGIISLHQRVLDEKVLPSFLMALRMEWVSRYASTYWRSVFQGFLRQDEHSWRLLVSDMAIYLAGLCHLISGQLPIPRKWALSEIALGRSPYGDLVRDCLTKAAGCDVVDRRQVISCYHAFSAAEVKILGENGLARGYWWRSVFHKRLPNLGVPTEVMAFATKIPEPAG